MISCTHSYGTGSDYRSFRATPCGAHSAPPAPFRTLRGGVVGQIVGWDFDAATSAATLGMLILFLFAAPHDPRLALAINIVTYFCTSPDSRMLSVGSYLAPILVRQANAEYVSTDTEH